MTRADEATRFKPGQSGNPRGRPRGSRNRLSEKFLAEQRADEATGFKPGQSVNPSSRG